MRVFLSRILITLMLMSCSVSAFAQASTKARTFDGTDDTLTSAATIDLSDTNEVSLAFWLYWDSFVDGDDRMLTTGASPLTTTGSIAIVPDTSGFGGGLFFFGRAGGTSGSFWCTIARPSAAAWHHYVLTMSLVSSVGTCTAYVDGSSVTATKQSDTASGDNLANLTLYLMSDAGSSMFGAGRVSDLAIWKSILTSGNASTLANCANNPGGVGTVAFWWPITQASPEPDSAGGVDLTVTTGTTNSDSNCVGGGGGGRPSNRLLMGVGD